MRFAEGTDSAVLRLEEKVAFLSRPESYPELTRHVETKETHMSWIFLTDNEAWKLKKPSKFDHLDLRSAEARRRNCDREILLNRRLAPGVYRGIVPLTVSSRGTLQLDQPGVIDDWLIRMRRLPADRMLDQAIENSGWSKEDLRKVGAVLARFYSTEARLPISTEAYVKQLTRELCSSREELTKWAHVVRSGLIDPAIAGALEFLGRHRTLLEERVRRGKIVEGHGDLRPEHICLENEPVIIDCLEFSRRLRIVDPASELMFLKMECERLGSPAAGDLIFESYCERAGDDPPDALLELYRTYHAAVRARVAILHLVDNAVRDRQKWVERAEHYLTLVRP
jgi:aminoglycoside phosphotransferase family enzyme